MILSFSTDALKNAILAGTKIHTLRTDSTRRWKPGMSIQFWRGNPRNVKQNPHQFGVGECKGVQSAVIYRRYNTLEIWINGRPLCPIEKKECIENDGLTTESFVQFFVPEPVDMWSGSLIHFTDKRY